MTTEREYREWFLKRNKQNRQGSGNRSNSFPKKRNVWIAILAILSLSFAINFYKSNSPTPNEQNPLPQIRSDQQSTPDPSPSESTNDQSPDNSFQVGTISLQTLESYEVKGFYAGSQQYLAQGKFIMIIVQATNRGNVSSQMNYFDIRLQDSQGRLYPVDGLASGNYQYYYQEQGKPLSTTILPEMSQRFILIFDVNPDAQSFQMVHASL